MNNTFYIVFKDLDKDKFVRGVLKVKLLITPVCKNSVPATVTIFLQFSTVITVTDANVTVSIA